MGINVTGHPPVETCKNIFLPLMNQMNFHTEDDYHRIIQGIIPDMVLRSSAVPLSGTDPHNTVFENQIAVYSWMLKLWVLGDHQTSQLHREGYRLPSATGG